MNKFLSMRILSLSLLLISTFSWGQNTNNTSTLFPKVANPNEQIFKIKADNALLEGVLRTPKKTGTEAINTTLPLVLIIADAGATDRDGNITDNIKGAPYRFLADNLAANGIASFRFDKRGVGNSNIDDFKKTVIFEDIILDAQKCLDSLRATQRFSKIVVLGHGEGALVGMILAQRAPIDALISVATTAKRIDTAMVDQVRRNSPELAYALRVVYDKWQKNEPVDSVAKGIKNYVHPAIRPFFLDQLQYMPTQEIVKVKVPTLIIQGKTDVAVPYASGVRLAKAKPDAQFYLHENMNHIMKDGDLNMIETKKVYENPKLPLSAGLTSTLVDFIKKQ